MKKLLYKFASDFIKNEIIGIHFKKQPTNYVQRSLFLTLLMRLYWVLANIKSCVSD